MTTLKNPVGIASEIVRAVRRDGGATQSIVAGIRPPLTGYAVSLPEHNVQVYAETFDGLDVLVFIDSRRHHLTVPGRYVGAWLDAKTGVVHLDVTEVHAERATAIALALERRELAIFDLAAGEDIATTATCKHCGQEIVPDGTRAWFDPDTWDSSIWRYSCPTRETPGVGHEPVL